MSSSGWGPPVYEFRLGDREGDTYAEGLGL